ncbi:MAG: hypothetical protein KDE33_09410 [Bacteroidetes bacterium]|nr:hypothetical protein [Bacteroidota bacterium]
MNITIDVPKKENLGEDAPPILLSSINQTKVIVAVLDGLGGSGSTLYEENGISQTGAYIASREVRNTIFRYFENLIEKEYFEISIVEIDELKRQIKADLNDKLRRQKFEQSKLKSSLIRTFPTTLALGMISKKNNCAEIDLLWAGDSRIYILNSIEGLIQLTKDDLKLDNDPYENIENDSPLSNMIHLDEDFIINHYRQNLSTPFFIVAATDGCFGYYPTPMHFEHLLISTLLNSNSENEWEEKIINELKDVSGDDFSLVIKLITNSQIEFSEAKELFRSRNEELYQTFMREIIRTESELNELRSKENELLEKISSTEKQRKDLYTTLWEKYKIKNYPNPKTEN